MSVERPGERLVLGFKGQHVPDWLRAFESRFGLGGVILFDYDAVARRYGNNVTSPEQLRKLCADLADLPSRPLVLVDQEGGKVRRLKQALGFCPLPSAEEFCRLTGPIQLDLASASYREMRQLGIHFNLAPVVDLNLNPANPDIGAHGRSYSDQPGTIRAVVAVLDQAARDAGLGLCLKHYPGLGAARTNSHHELTDLTGIVSEEQLGLFWELGGRINGQAILISHGLVRDWDAECPVSVSRAGLGPLRERLPQALLISDDMQMQGLRKMMPLDVACRSAVEAGLDLILIGNNLLDEQALMADLASHLAGEIGADPALAEAHRGSLERVHARKRQFAGLAA